MSASSHDFARLMVPVAIEVLGEPNQTLSSKIELRWGSRGAVSVDKAKGTWCDHADGDCGGGVLDLLKVRKGLEKPDALQWLRDHKYLPPAEGNRRAIMAVYDYLDAGGKLLFQVVRFKPKDFRQRRPDGQGGWIWKTQGIPLVLYRLPKLIAGVAAGQTIYIVEGEKGVASLEALGLTATCSPGGAGKWRKAYSPPLRGADVVLLPDNDQAGRDHVDSVVSMLQGVAKRIRVLALPGLAEKGDVADWVAAGGTAVKLEELVALVEGEPPPDEERDHGINGHVKPSPKVRSKNEKPRIPLEEWQKYLLTDDHGQVIPNLANAALALRQAPTLAGLVAYDEMLRHALLERTVPGSGMPAVTGARPVQDADVGALQEWLQRHGIQRLGKDTAHQALDLVAREHAFHPVRDYLNGLRWDGTPRIDKWLSYYLGAEPSAYVAHIGRWFLIAMVARIMQPGCKADYMLVLEGPQGAQKSKVCAILAGGWFSDNLPDLHHGDQVRLSMHLRGKWLIEIAEMSSIGRAEAGALKAFLTQTEERYTPKFARNEVIEPRQSLFIGTTNKATYLRDETGGRRFWPLVTGTIAIEALEDDRDQLFAEAVVAYRNGDKWWPDRDFEAEHIKPEQEARYEADAWEEAASKYLAGKDRVTVLELAREVLHIDLPKIGTSDQRRISAVLETLGWQPGKRGTGGIRWWVRSENVVTQVTHSDAFFL